jgi:DNA-directed RNA polymerase subunit M/transcription elongation factor TFIIS
VIDWMELNCQHCDWHTLCGPPQMLHWLKIAGMVRRDAAPEADLLPELLRSAAGRMKCPKCGQAGLSAEANQDDADDESWGMARKCAVCENPIPPERLEVFPNAELCVECQSRSDRGESTGALAYCPHCGTVMTLRQDRRGVTRYVMACPQCRR